MSKIIYSLRFLVYCIIYLYGLKYIFSLNLDATFHIPFLLSVMWFIFLIAGIIGDNTIRKIERWSQVYGTPEMIDHLKTWHK